MGPPFATDNRHAGQVMYAVDSGPAPETLEILKRGLPGGK